MLTPLLSSLHPVERSTPGAAGIQHLPRDTLPSMSGAGFLAIPPEPDERRGRVPWVSLSQSESVCGLYTALQGRVALPQVPCFIWCP